MKAISIVCKTESEVYAVLGYLHLLGLKWINGDSLNNDSLMDETIRFIEADRQVVSFQLRAGSSGVSRYVESSEEILVEEVRNIFSSHHGCEVEFITAAEFLADVQKLLVTPTTKSEV